MHTTRTTRFTLWFAALCTVFGIALTPQLAHAHDVLVESTPEIGSSVADTPSEVRLRFSGTPLSGEGLANLIVVTDHQGNQWQDGEVAVDGYELAIGLCEGLPQGDYTVAYRVIYSDGHTGEARFGFTNADSTAPTQGTPQDCGELSADATQTAPDSAPESDAPNESQDTSDAEAADQPAADNSTTSASIPAWVWISAIAGIIIVAIIVVMLLRGSKEVETLDQEDDA